MLTRTLSLTFTHKLSHSLTQSNRHNLSQTVLSYIQQLDTAKAKLISHMAKMGQPILPFPTGAIPAQPDHSDSKTEVGSIVSLCVCAPSVLYGNSTFAFPQFQFLTKSILFLLLWNLFAKYAGKGVRPTNLCHV